MSHPFAVLFAAFFFGVSATPVFAQSQTAEVPANAQLAEGTTQPVRRRETTAEFARVDAFNWQAVD